MLYFPLLFKVPSGVIYIQGQRYNIWSLDWQAALAANNLYHHLTYEGAVNLESIDDPVERAGLEAQVHLLISLK